MSISALTIPSPPPRAHAETVRDGRESGLMTVGELARRTGLSHKAIRELEGRGLIYSAGRSESNYRLFNETALCCVGAVAKLRSLGLTLAEIEQLHTTYLKDPDRPPAAQFARLLEHVEERLRTQIATCQQTLGRIEAFRADSHAQFHGNRQSTQAGDP